MASVFLSPLFSPAPAPAPAPSPLPRPRLLTFRLPVRSSSSTFNAAIRSAASPQPLQQQQPPQAEESHDVVIAGGGIAGMATALALHRTGLKSIVLEQSPALRITGTSLVIWTNAWRALEALGIAGGLKDKFTRLVGFEFYATGGKCLAKLLFTEKHRDVEMRGVERKMLLETLVQSLPSETVRYNARVVKVHKIDELYTRVELQDGSTIRARVLIGCDGIGSIVARHMGFGEARYTGYVGIRGLGLFPEGHNVSNVLSQTIGKGVRVGFLPLDSNRVYWFLVFNQPPGTKVRDPELIKEEALSLVQGWSEVIIEVIKNSPLDTLSRAAISDRWLWPFVGPNISSDGITLAGDAMHPVTPNLAQGGCSALEDAVVLGRLLSKAMKREPSVKSNKALVNGNLEGEGTSLERERIRLALESYANERRRRMFPLAVQAYAIGAVLQVDFQLFCSLRDAILPKVLRMESFTDYSLYDCGTL